jgi:PHD/YefM family antitoxin component YafN of YafNO toxin-antitoxin module
MINLKDGIDSLTNFKRQSAAFLKRLKKSGDPMVLTVNGKARVVIQDADAYQEMRYWAAKAEREATIAAIKEGLADVEAGRMRPAKDVIREVARKFGLPDPTASKAK